ncbi:MAG TPA: transglycosylase family protein [Solirubrobacterales bacterium]
MHKKTNFAAAASAVALGVGVAATAAFAADGAEPVAPDPGAEGVEIALLEREGEDLNRAINEHRTEELTGRYRELYAEAEKLDAEPKANVLADKGEPELDELSNQVPELREDVEKAREEAEEAAAAEGSEAAVGGLVGGVSQSTLDAIAACESGGDPTAVNAAGYYGKYQFDTGTWASVGGSGNPAEASEAEQDMRASMLYARAGSSPWPVCGQ